MDTISVVGFDFDYVLANYTGELNPLIYDLTKNNLVNRLGYGRGEDERRSNSNMTEEEDDKGERML